MITAIIVDDERKSRVALESLLQTFCPEVELVGIASNADEGIRLIKASQPKLVFLDIEMPNGSGFDLLAHFDTLDFEVIFTTAYDQYALKAFKVTALDYLLKPIDPEDLQAAVQKLDRKLPTREKEDPYRELIRQLRPGKMKMALPTLSGIRFIPVDTIIRLEADGSYTKVICENSTPVTVSKNIKELEENLPEALFFRAHKSHIINLEFVESYTKGNIGTITMRDQSQLPLSRRKKKDFLDRMV